MIRSQGRAHDALRPIQITRGYTRYAEGSVLIACGQTQVLCNASVNVGQVPRFRKGTGLGWLTAEYSMLPRATRERCDREASQGRQTGRTQEIQRLIGRSLRSCLDFKKLGEHTIVIDCDVIQADGGTRTTAITGACVALYDAVQFLMAQNLVRADPFFRFISGISVGIHDGCPILDLDQQEDSSADTDMNVVLSDGREFIEIQGTAEKKPFAAEELTALLALAQKGGEALYQEQKKALAL